MSENSNTSKTPRLILASKSAARQTMLKSAGLSFQSHPADLNENAIKNEGKSPQFTAQNLALAKAQHVSKKYADAIVIGSDQVLSLNGLMLNKASDEDEARDKLKQLRGQTHHLISAVAIVQGGKNLWQYDAVAFLKMYDFSDQFLESYLSRAGDALTHNVGAYALEGLGAQLFESIEGDYFTILGMPLLPLLTYLRNAHGVGL